ncbi:MAG: type II toxin-antitoxin system RatA family toxin [Gammaproteobacteria bacterium]|nr:type II toxin-antitoxin system RatA family toxin [Gammaproteobacteria bacterium]
MPVVKKSALVAYSVKEMFDLVNDIESYPQFLPWCRSTKLLSHTETELCGQLEVARAGIRQKFSTCNHLHPYNRIDIELKEGPFTELSGSWRFLELRDDACKVELELDFSFSGALISKAFGAVFAQIANTLVDAFCKRAREVHRGE